MRLIKNNDNPINEEKIIDTLRSLALDINDKDKIGSSGLILGGAPIVYSLFSKHIRLLIENPNFYNRDRFIFNKEYLPLIYAISFLIGYDIELDELKMDKLTYKTKIPGVDIIPNMNGENIALGVGVATGEVHTRSLLNHSVVDFYTYVLANSEDLMEGISYEAASFAGHNKLNKLIVLYDSNDTLKDGKLVETSKENIRELYEGMGWNTIIVTDDDNLSLINKAIEDAKKSNLPTLIEIKTTIGKYSENQGTNISYYESFTTEEKTKIKEKLNQRDIPFTISNDVMEDIQYLITERNKDLTEDYDYKVSMLDEDNKRLLDSLILTNKRISSSSLDVATRTEKEKLTTTAGKILNAYTKDNLQLFGGSDDFYTKFNAYLEEAGDFSSENYALKNIKFGKREKLMSHILNGLSLVGYRPYLVSDITNTANILNGIKMASSNHLSPIYLLSYNNKENNGLYDIESLSILRNTIGLDLFRLADANELMGSFKMIMEKEENPGAICVANNTLKTLEETSISETKKGGYIVKKEKIHLDGILLSCGEELHLALEVAENLFTKGLDLRVVSMPNLERFLNEDKEYIDEVLPVEKIKIVIEMSNDSKWNKLIFNDKYIIRQDNFVEDDEFVFTTEKLTEKVESLLK